MAGQAARTAIVQLDARRGQCLRRARTVRSPEQAASDRLAPWRSVTSPVARRRPLPDAENFGGEVSFRSLPLWFVYSITSSARARKDSGIARLMALAAGRLMINSNLVGCSIGRSAGFAPLKILST